MKIGEMKAMERTQIKRRLGWKRLSPFYPFTFLPFYPFTFLPFFPFSLLPFFLFTLLPFFLVGCESDSYDKGEGKYSLMQADFAELQVDAQQQAVSFTTDEGAAYTLVKPATAQWIQTADTVYRALIYYNKVDEARAEVVALGNMPTMRPVPWWRLEEEMPSDPVGLESSWVSRGGKYLNLGLLLRTGQVDGEDGIHTIGVVQDTVLLNDDRTRTAVYSFRHDQSGVPEYYTNRRYVSILIPDSVPLDTVRLSIVTYDGLQQKVYPL